MERATENGDMASQPFIKLDMAPDVTQKFSIPRFDGLYSCNISQDTRGKRYKND